MSSPQLDAIDAEVGRLMAAGDRAAAATAALRGLGPKILGYLHTVLRNEADAAEAFGQFAENLWKGLDTFRGESSFRVWAFRLAWNVALNMRNEAWRRRVRHLATGEASRIAEEVRNATVLRMERHRRGLEKLREALTPEDQTLLSLRIDQELSWQEIAEVMSAQGDEPADPAAPRAAPADAATLRKRYERLKARLSEMARTQGLVE